MFVLLGGLLALVRSCVCIEALSIWMLARCARHNGILIECERFSYTFTSKTYRFFALSSLAAGGYWLGPDSRTHTHKYLKNFFFAFHMWHTFLIFFIFIYLFSASFAIVRLPHTHTAHAYCFRRRVFFVGTPAWFSDFDGKGNRWHLGAHCTLHSCCSLENATRVRKRSSGLPKWYSSWPGCAVEK